MNKITSLLLGLLLAQVPNLHAQSLPWTGTWAVTPQSGGGSFNQQTIRQIVYTSVGGSTARIRLSNLFGSASIVISDVHIALAGSGSSIQAGTDHAVTFGGSGSVTIGVGADVNSDSISMTIPSLSEVAISFYVPNSTNLQTYHQFSFQTNYVANGDVSGSTNISVASTPTSYYCVTNLDVQNSSLTGAVVTFGASITDGYQSTQNANDRWPNALARRFSPAGINVGVINQGVSGNQLLNNNGTLSALNRFQHDVVGQPNVRWVIFSDDPINDVGNNPSITGAQLIAGVQQLISEAHSAGLKFFGSTLTPFKGASYWTAAGETAREQYNAFVLSANNGCDGVVDQAAATSDPSNPEQYLPAYDSGDHLHPNDAGYQAIANAVNLSFFTAATEGPFGGTAAAVPGTVQNENYDTGGQGLAYNVTSINGTDNSYRSDGVDLEATSDTGGGVDLGWTSSGQWFRYTVNVATAGTYTVSFRVAAAAAVGTNAGSLHLQTISGTNLSGAVTVPGTGGWQTWTTITASVILPAGQQVIELFQDTGGYNLNYMTFASAGNPTSEINFDVPGGVSGFTNYFGQGAATDSGKNFWNAIVVNGTTSSCKLDDGSTTSPITLTVSSDSVYTAGGQGTQGTPSGLQTPFYDSKPGPKTCTLANVPAGTYNLCLYGINGANGDCNRGTTFTVGSSSLSTVNTSAAFNTFLQGNDFVLFRNIVVGSGGGSIVFTYQANTSVLVSGVANNIGNFNGLQLIKQ